MSDGERDRACVGIVAEADTDESSCKFGYVGPVRHEDHPETASIRLQSEQGRLVCNDAACVWLCRSEVYPQSGHLN